MLHCLLTCSPPQEINALLSGGVLTEEDESAVEEELDALIAAAVQKQLPDAPTAAENPEVELPDVPETLPGTVSLCDMLSLKNICLTCPLLAQCRIGTVC